MQLTSLLVSLTLIVVGSCHPQCLDFTFPFKPAKTLVMCREYGSFGCCSREADHTLIATFLNLLSTLDSNGRRYCAGYLRTLLCQRCSPYAAHIYDAENLLIARTFPGLCPEYCITVVTKCSQVVRNLVNNLTLTRLLDQKNFQAFCKATTTIDPDYCYPDLRNNPELSENLGKIEFYQKNRTCIPICLEEIARRRANPLSLKHSKDGTHRLFVVEQLGLIWIYLPDKSRLDPPFLDLRNIVVANKLRYDERGMLDIEFHPNYKANGLFYLYYSFAVRGRDYIKISEMKVSDNNMNRANVSSERSLLEIRQPAKNHNGGRLLFLDGIDKNLYIFTGDGGRAGDPFGLHGNGQNKRTYLGKVLRIDVSSRGEKGQEYAIPQDNPFVNDSSFLPEIYALGVRNLWRCSADRGGDTEASKGRIFCGDVGQNRYEEIDIIQKGGNYGWRGYEGNFCYDRRICNSQFIENYVPPIHAYSHSVGKSVTGGYVYRGCQNPNLKGKYIFGDYHNGKIFALTERLDGSWKRENICMASSEACKGDKLQNSYGKHILSFGESEDGEVYMLSTGTAKAASKSGSVYRIVDPSGGGDPSQCEADIADTSLNSETTKIPFQQASDEESDVSVRLVSAYRSVYKGRVEIFFDGEWGTICDDQWDIRDAHVVCIMLGFRYALEASRRARFGPGTGQVWLDEVGCKGNEQNIGQCNHAGWANQDCDHTEDAGVVCKT